MRTIANSLPVNLTRLANFEAFRQEYGGNPLPSKLAEWLNGTLAGIENATNAQLLTAYRELMEVVIASPACMDQLKDQQLQTAEDLAEIRQHPEVLIFEIVGLLTGSRLSTGEKTMLTQYLLVADQVFVRGL
jgi:hypothetical protein